MRQREKSIEEQVENVKTQVESVVHQEKLLAKDVQDFRNEKQQCVSSLTQMRSDSVALDMELTNAQQLEVETKVALEAKKAKLQSECGRFAVTKNTFVERTKHIDAETKNLEETLQHIEQQVAVHNDALKVAFEKCVEIQKEENLDVSTNMNDARLDLESAIARLDDKKAELASYEMEANVVKKDHSVLQLELKKFLNLNQEIEKQMEELKLDLQSRREVEISKAEERKQEIAKIEEAKRMLSIHQQQFKDLEEVEASHQLYIEQQKEALDSSFADKKVKLSEIVEELDSIQDKIATLKEEYEITKAKCAESIASARSVEFDAKQSLENAKRLLENKPDLESLAKSEQTKRDLIEEINAKKQTILSNYPFLNSIGLSSNPSQSREAQIEESLYDLREFCRTRLDQAKATYEARCQTHEDDDMNEIDGIVDQDVDHDDSSESSAAVEKWTIQTWKMQHPTFLESGPNLSLVQAFQMCTDDRVVIQFKDARDAREFRQLFSSEDNPYMITARSGLTLRKVILEKKEVELPVGESVIISTSVSRLQSSNMLTSPPLPSETSTPFNATINPDNSESSDDSFHFHMEVEESSDDGSESSDDSFHFHMEVEESSDDGTKNYEDNDYNDNDEEDEDQTDFQQSITRSVHQEHNIDFVTQSQATTNSSKPLQRRVVFDSLVKVAFKEAVNSNLLQCFADCGKKLSLQAVRISDPEVTDMSEFFTNFMQKVGVNPDDQKAFGNGRIQVSFFIEQVKGENTLPANLQKSGIYAIIEEIDGIKYILKFGCNINGNRHFDYRLNPKQSFVVVQLLVGGWDDDEEAMKNELFKCLASLAESTNMDISDEFKSFLSMIVNGGHEHGLLRPLAFRAMESFSTTQCHIQTHRKHNPQELFAGVSTKYYQKTKEQVEESVDILFDNVQSICQSNNLSSGDYLNTWNVAEEYLDEEKRGKYLSAQVMLSMYTISPIPGYENKFENMLEGVENPTSLFDTSFSDSQREDANVKFIARLQTAENQPASLLVANYNPEATAHRSERDLLAVACSNGWKIVTEIIFGDERDNKNAKIVLVSKNRSVVIFMNSAGTCLDPTGKFSTSYQRDALFAIHVVHKVLDRFNWNGESSLGSKDTAFIAGMWRDRLGMFNLHASDISFNLKALFARDMYNTNMYDGDFSKLKRRSKYITSRGDKMQIRPKFENKKVHLIDTCNKDLNEFIRKEFKDKEYLKRVRNESRNEVEFQKGATILLELIIAKFFAQNNHSNTNIRSDIIGHVLDHRYGDPKKNLALIQNNGNWRSNEVQQFHDIIMFYYGNKLEDKIPKQGMNLKRISMGVPTRSVVQCKCFWSENLKPKINKGKKEMTYGDVINALGHLLRKLELVERHSNHFIIFGVGQHMLSTKHPGNLRVQELFRARLSAYQRTNMRNMRGFTKQFWKDLTREGIELYKYVDDGPKLILIEEASEKETYLMNRMKFWKNLD
ncbi:hypothetical protein CTEN210_04820 [Chaetoceros tenuissimus]|uniref:Uncharacterized protein n=1 Tax=Chaetoceros tenuissimus TaxID=426638 RepID=A0AAD3CPA8_9STRA|nr:hypothetical protein CTEN210_04820 [Chaetoceros tenuissimus]